MWYRRGVGDSIACRASWADECVYLSDRPCVWYSIVNTNAVREHGCNDPFGRFCRDAAHSRIDRLWLYLLVVRTVRWYHVERFVCNMLTWLYCSEWHRGTKTVQYGPFCYLVEVFLLTSRNAYHKCRQPVHMMHFFLSGTNRVNFKSPWVQKFVDRHCISKGKQNFHLLWYHPFQLNIVFSIHKSYNGNRGGWRDQIIVQFYTGRKSSRTISTS